MHDPSLLQLPGWKDSGSSQETMFGRGFAGGRDSTDCCHMAVYSIGPVQQVLVNALNYVN